MKVARRRAVPLALLVLVAIGSPVEAWAQAERGIFHEPGHRKWIGLGIGLAVGLVPAMVANYDSQTGGRCKSRACVATLAGAAGGAVGFLIGRERDIAAQRREAAGPTLAMRSAGSYLDLVDPQIIEKHEDGAVIVSRDGLLTVQRDGSMARKGGEIRGVSSAAALPAHDVVLVTTDAGLFSFTLRDDAPDGRQVLRESVRVVQAIGNDEVVVAGGEILRRMRVSGMGTQATVAEVARVEAVGPISDMAFSSFAGVLWTLANDRLVARSASQLQEIGSVALPAPGRTLSLSGGRALVTAGGSGVFVVDVSRPESPRLLGQLGGIDFIFDGMLDSDRAYLAAGSVGLLVVDVSDPTAPSTIGVGRRLGYVSAVAPAEDGRLFVLDRSGPRLLTVDPGVAGQARE